jgi:alkylhydroperoxidase family enzyme
MAWIENVDISQWHGDLAELRNRVVDPATGQADNILTVHSLDAGSLRAHLNLYTQAMRGTSSLPKVDREMIALVVSKINGCHY